MPRSAAAEKPAKASGSKTTAPAPKKLKRKAASPGSSDINASSDEAGDAFEPAAGSSSDNESDGEASVASDAIDEPVVTASTSKKRKAAGSAKAPAASSSSPAKAKGKGKAVALPEAVPAGQISQRTVDFLGKLRRPEFNDRDWFQSNDATFRAVEREWNAFVGAASEAFTKGDWTLPVFPPKDLIYRIYRDVRFSKDKTPYKTNMSASFSRTGRKGPYAGYYLAVSSNGKSMIAGGKWGPDKNDLATIRTNLERDSKPLRKLISAPEFVKLFGPAKATGKRVNIFGRDDELKNAPKGVAKDHADIDLLRLRSFVVSRHFADADVIRPGFMDQLVATVKVMAPFVQYLNDLTSPQSESEGQGADEDEDEDED